MKKLFIYYSLSGNGDVVADYLKNKKYDIRKVIMKDKIPKSYIGQILTGGFLAGINHKAKLDDFNNLIKFSAILSKDQVKLLFMEDLTNIPLISDDKYLNEDERIELLIESKSRLKKVDSNLYLFFNHEE